MTAPQASNGGRRVLITGGASGIGAAFVRGFAAQGDHVVFLDIDTEAGEQISAEVAGSGHRADFFHCDLADTDVIQDTIADWSAQNGHIGVLINNAGDDARHAFADVTARYWDRQMAVNLRQQFFCAQAVVPGMIATGGGVIINLGSTSWMNGGADMVVYATAKSAVLGLTRSMSRLLGKDGIRVNAIAPGWVHTEKQLHRAQSEDPGVMAAYTSQQSIPIPLQVDDICRTALWLASDSAAMVTGQQIVVDGGVT